ncbi:MAG: AMP-binding protein [Desulfomonilaceae bacterium]|nr:AMP-binding protein [Desulfomonilaceae bacterium]
MGLYDITVYNLLGRNARVNGDGTALVFGENTISHEQLLEIVDRLAAGLRSAGVGRGSRIGILAKNCPEYVYLYGAAAKLGAVVVPINWRLTPSEIGYILADALPAVLLVEAEFKPLLNFPEASSSIPKQCLSLGDGDGAFKGLQQILDGPAPTGDAAGFDDGYVMIYTAAVSGKPRGAVLTHKGLFLASMELVSQWGLTAEDTNLAVLPLFHVAGILTLMSAIEAGGTNVILRDFDPETAVKCIWESGVSFFISFPPMLSSLLDRAEAESVDITSIRHLLGIDNPDTIDRFEKMAGATFWSTYGQTETSGIASFAPYKDQPGSAGLPIRPVEVQVVDEYDNILPPGKSGEIVVRGPTIFQGYWNLPTETAHTFRAGWHHTGDLGRFSEDGYLWFEGRLSEKELIKSGGENVYPAEVEKAVLEHPIVEEACVIGVPDEQWGETIKAVCVLKSGETVKESELIEFVASRIARYKKPKRVVFVTKLPKKPDGGVDRAKVKGLYG